MLENPGLTLLGLSERAFEAMDKGLLSSLLVGLFSLLQMGSDYLFA